MHNSEVCLVISLQSFRSARDIRFEKVTKIATETFQHLMLRARLKFYEVSLLSLSNTSFQTTKHVPLGVQSDGGSYNHEAAILTVLAYRACHDEEPPETNLKFLGIEICKSLLVHRL